MTWITDESTNARSGGLSKHQCSRLGLELEIRTEPERPDVSFESDYLDFGWIYDFGIQTNAKKFRTFSVSRVSFRSSKYFTKKNFKLNFQTKKLLEKKYKKYYIHTCNLQIPRSFSNQKFISFKKSIFLKKFRSLKILHFRSRQSGILV